MRALLDIRIGTMIRANAPDPATYVRQIVGLGFESIEPFFWQTMNKDLPLLARQLREAIGDTDVTIDTLGMFGNPLEDGDLDRQTLAGWEALIDNAHHFGATTIAGFTGRIRGQPIEASLPQFKKVWGELAPRCGQGRAARVRELLDGRRLEQRRLQHRAQPRCLGFDVSTRFHARAMSALNGSHATRWSALIDPHSAGPQIRSKDSAHARQVRHHQVGCRQGARNRLRRPVRLPPRRPASATADWTAVISELRLGRLQGDSIDIEGWHDPVYREELEMTGQVRALDYLKQCRGGARFVANPA